MTLIVQFAREARFAGQLLVCEKSPAALTPETTMLALPVLVNVTACTALELPTGCSAKVNEVADKVFAGAPAVPLRVSVCGLLGAESITTIVPVRLPTEVGVNVTTTVHVPVLATSTVQLLVWAKSPVARMLLTVICPFPVLVNTIDWGALVLPTDCEAKLRLVGLKLAAEAMPVPPRVTVCGLP